MVKNYNNICNSKVRSMFRSVDIYFIIALIILGIPSAVFILNIAIDSVAGNLWNPYGDIVPPYVGIALLVGLIILIFAIIDVKKLRKEVCKDSSSYYLIGD